jgi:hypothetical protein
MSALGHNRSVAIFSESRLSRLYSARPVTLFYSGLRLKPPARHSASTHIGHGPIAPCLSAELSFKRTAHLPKDGSQVCSPTEPSTKIRRIRAWAHIANSGSY